MPGLEHELLQLRDLRSTISWTACYKKGLGQEDTVRVGEFISNSPLSGM